VARSRALGADAVAIDGNDIGQVLDACDTAVAAARDGAGPQVVVADTMRMLGHAIHDGAEYVPSELLAIWEQRDPLNRAERHLRALGVGDDLLSAIDGDARDVVADGVWA
jgi:pyruvate dehydrogenase E1 component alpha subunit